MADDIKSILPESLKRAGISDQVQDEQVKQVVMQEIERVVGPELIKKIRFLYLKDQTITIASLNGEATSKINDDRTRMIDKINTKLGQELAKEWRFLT